MCRKHMYEIVERFNENEGIVMTKPIVSTDDVVKVKRKKKKTGRESQPPKWFQKWFPAFEERINSRFDRIEFNIQTINTRLAKQDKFNQYVKDVFERNNLIDPFAN